jgi:hypothetical protein
MSSIVHELQMFHNIFKPGEPFHADQDLNTGSLRPRDYEPKPVQTRTADPNHFNADANPDPHPTPHQKVSNLRPLLYILGLHFVPLRLHCSGGSDDQQDSCGTHAVFCRT